MYLFTKIKWDAVNSFFFNIFRQVTSVFSLFIFFASSFCLLISLFYCFVALVLTVQSFVHLSIPSSCSSNVDSRFTEGESDCEDAKQYLIKTKPTYSGKHGHDVSTAVLEAFDAHFWNVADVWYVTGLQLNDDQMRCVKDTIFVTFNQKKLMKNDNFSTNEICNKYVNLVMQFEIDFCLYFVKDIFNFDKGIIWKLLFKLKKAYVEKQKQAV